MSTIVKSPSISLTLSASYLSYSCHIRYQNKHQCCCQWHGEADCCHLICNNEFTHSVQLNPSCSACPVIYPDLWKPRIYCCVCNCTLLSQLSSGTTQHFISVKSNLNYTLIYTQFSLQFFKLIFFVIGMRVTSSLICST